MNLTLIDYLRTSMKDIDNLEDHIELRLMRTQQVKNSLLQFAGIANSVYLS